LSSYIRQAKSGASVVINERGMPVAGIVPTGRSLQDRTENLVEVRLVTWSRKKLSGIADGGRPSVGGSSMILYLDASALVKRYVAEAGSADWVGTASGRGRDEEPDLLYGSSQGG
jgi:antitoxin (DNA-binding transcriptional repressor) of toxin-antitoxin stability system